MGNYEPIPTIVEGYKLRTFEFLIGDHKGAIYCGEWNRGKR